MTALRVAAVIVLLLPNTITDVRKKEVLPLFSICVGAAGFLVNLLAEKTPPVAALAALLPGALFFVLSFVTRGGVGIGDAIVVTALGGWLPCGTCFLVVILSLAAVSVAAAAVATAGRARRPIPYVPFLLAAYGFSFLLKL